MMRLQQAGDTIVEVLFAVAVVGLTIASAYGIASLSLQNARQAQERGEALKIAEGQIEAIRAIASNNSATDDGQIFRASSNAFCLNGLQRVDGFDTTWGDIVPVDADPLDVGYPADCVEGLYHRAIDVSADSGTPGLYNYEVVVRWFNLGNDRKNEVKLVYRMFQP